MHTLLWHIKRTGLLAIQRYRLQRTLNRAASHSPYYRHKLESVDWKRIHSRDDLHQLGWFTPNHDLQDDFQQFVTRSTDQITSNTRTTGSTGKPKIVMHDDADWKRWIRGLAISTWFCPNRLKKSVLILYCSGSPEWSAGNIIADSYRSQNSRVICMGNTHPVKEVINTIRREKITAIYGTPSYLNYLVLNDEDDNNLRELGVELIGLGAEPATPSLRRRLTEAFDCMVLDGYGLMEFGSSVAGEIYPGSDYFFIINHLAEVVNPETDEHVSPGETGELILTSLMQETTPLIRYRTGDLVTWKPAHPDYPVVTDAIGEIVGRIDDMITIGCGENVSPNLFARALTPLPFISEFQVQVSGDNGSDLITIRLEGDADGPQREQEISDSLFRHVECLQHEVYLSHTIRPPQFVWQEPGTFLKESPIKHKRLIDLRPKN